MSLLKRHAGRRRNVGRRVAGVAVGVGLMVVGLASPAYAVLDATAISPDSGPVGCVVIITGTDFNNPNVNSVVFLGNVANGADDRAANFQIRSATEIWTTVPAGAVNGPIRLTNTATQFDDTPAFTVANPGNCAPTIASFTPTCGPGGAGVTGTDVTITGTNLLIDAGGNLTGTGGPPATAALVQFAPYTVLATPTSVAPNTTTISVNVPTGALDGPIKVFTFAAPTGLTSTASFDAGTCITDFQPQSGAVGSVVTLTGVGFQGATSVKFFNGVEAIFQIVTDTETVDTITATVPFGAATGPITVTAPGGTATTATDFTIGGGGGPQHERNVTLKLSGALRMKGKVKVPDGTTDCANAVPVKLQRKKSGGGWKTLKTVTTDASGAYSGKVKNKAGKYRSVAKKVTLANGDVCLKDVSPVRTN